MPGHWKLLATRPGGTVTALVTSGSSVLATTPAGLRRSTDGGRSWSVVGIPAPSMELVVPSPLFASDVTLLAGTASGLLRSVDGGRTWQEVLVGSRVLAVAFSPAFREDGLVLVGTEADGLLRSTDRGRTWTSGNPGLLDLTVLGLACSPAFEVDRTAFAATASGLFYSTNAGRAWRAIETVPGEPAVQCLAVSPRFPSDPTVVAGTEADGLLRSLDAGETWHALDALAERSVTALAWSATGILAAATDTGVMVSDDGGATWRTVGEELSGPVLTVAFAPDGSLLAGMPRDGVARSSDLEHWERAVAGLQANLVVAVVPSAESTLYLAGLEDGVAVSVDAGATWESANDGLRPETVVFGLAAGADGLFAATSSGLFLKRGRTDHWQRVHPTAARSVRVQGHRVVALGMTDVLIASSDNGVSWHTQPSPASGLSDPMMGVVNGQRVGLPATFSALETSPNFAHDRTVLAATSAGVFLSRDAGASFQTWSEGMGEVPVVAIAFSPTYATDGLVYAVELGGRIWRHTEP